MVDCTATRKYYHFVRLMGREASHLTLEVALQTHPNMAFVGEEVKEAGLTLDQITSILADLVVDRSAAGMDYGVVLIPEGEHLCRAPLPRAVATRLRCAPSLRASAERLSVCSVGLSLLSRCRADRLHPGGGHPHRRAQRAAGAARRRRVQLVRGHDRGHDGGGAERRLSPRLRAAPGGDPPAAPPRSRPPRERPGKGP